MSAVTSCFLTSVEKIKQQPSTQRKSALLPILDKESSYTVKNHQLPSSSFLAKKIMPYKPQRRCYTLNSARQFTFVLLTSLGDFSSSCFLSTLSWESTYTSVQEGDSRKLSLQPRKSWNYFLPDKMIHTSAEVHFTSWRLFLEEQLLFLPTSICISLMQYSEVDWMLS